MTTKTMDRFGSTPASPRPAGFSTPKRRFYMGLRLALVRDSGLGVRDSGSSTPDIFAAPQRGTAMLRRQRVGPGGFRPDSAGREPSSAWRRVPALPRACAIRAGSTATRRAREPSARSSGSEQRARPAPYRLGSRRARPAPWQSRIAPPFWWGKGLPRRSRGTNGRAGLRRRPGHGDSDSVTPDTSAADGRVANHASKPTGSPRQMRRRGRNPGGVTELS